MLRDDNNGSGKTFRTEIVFDELLDLSSSLSDESQDGDVRVGSPQQHRQETRLAHPGTGHDADPLTATQGEETVDDAHAGLQLPGDQRTFERQGSDRVQGTTITLGEWWATVDRLAVPVENSPHQVRADGCRQTLVRCVDRLAGPQPVQRAERERSQTVPLDPHNLGRDSIVADEHDVTRSGVDADDLGVHADDSVETTDTQGGRSSFDLSGDEAHGIISSRTRCNAEANRPSMEPLA